MGTIEAGFQLTLGSFALNAKLKLPASGITVISGPSGSGKTLLLRCMAGLERPEFGYCKVNETIWQDSAKGYFLASYQRPLGYVFQEACLFPHLSVQQNIDYGRKRNKSAKSKKSSQAIIDLLNIGHLLARKPEKLSGGEKQRVAIARALAVQPKLLLMDEPLAALDQAHKQEILPYLRALQRELQLPIFYVTHSPQEVTQLADHLVLLEQGCVLASDTLQTVLTRLDLPLAQSQRASSVITAEVSSYDHEFLLLQLKFSGGILSVPHPELPHGNERRVRIYARDLSLSLAKPSSITTENSFQAAVVGLVNTASGYTTVSLRVGNDLVLAQLTRKAASLLDLKQGQLLLAEIKNAAILS